MQYTVNRFGQDDDSIMQELIRKLDLDSVAMRLSKLGFAQLRPALYSSKDIRRFARKYGDDGIELFIVGKNPNSNSLRVASLYNGHLPAYTDVIKDWDQWEALEVALLLNTWPATNMQRTAGVNKPPQTQTSSSGDMINSN